MPAPQFDVCRIGRRAGFDIRGKNLTSKSMKITSKGQVTIPIHIREQFGLLPDTEVVFRSGRKRGAHSAGARIETAAGAASG